jgi:tetratricopeptide (TPR) repeat protein
VAIKPFYRLFLLLALLGGASLGLGGCERPPTSGFVAEVDEPNFRRGRELLRQGRDQEALASFLRVIAKRGDDAAESHLEVGLLYLEKIRDPIAAIYHFRRFRELKPNSPQADLVRQRIDAATRDFARTLPAQPLENQNRRNDLLERLEQLQAENASLKTALAANRVAGPIAAPSPATRPGPTLTPPPVTGGGLQIERAPVTGAPTEAETRPRTPPTAPTRTHTVVRGDTLYSLAQRFYGNQSRWRDIYEANRGRMRSENDLQIGMELVIPQ